MAKRNSKSEPRTTEAPQPLIRSEFYDRVRCDYLPLQGAWISQAGFTPGMPIRIRVMPDCIVITTQNTRELYGCAEGLSVAYVNRQKMKLWLEGFPGTLNDTGDIPVIRRESPRYDCLKRGKD
ncbi:MAG: endoribonuclease SymE [Proteobacteria bacterium]|nr:endoribonuclease SymE [Pseudomonadota bacterium]